MACFLLGSGTDADSGPVHHAGSSKYSYSDAQLMIVYFNFFELVSISIEKGIMDDDFFKTWYAGNFIRVWNYSRSAIGALRVLHSNERLYAMWEHRARIWGDQLNIKVHDAIEYSLPELVKMSKAAAFSSQEA
jgi:hypothetical protein